MMLLEHTQPQLAENRGEDKSNRRNYNFRQSALLHQPCSCILLTEKEEKLNRISLLLVQWNVILSI